MRVSACLFAKSQFKTQLESLERFQCVVSAGEMCVDFKFYLLVNFMNGS